MKRIQPTIIACITAFIVGFVLAWVIKPAELQVIAAPATPAEQTAPSQTAAQAETSYASESAESAENTQESTPSTASDSELIWNGANTVTDPITGATVERAGHYTSRDEVALYIFAFGDVPSNYITKSKARREGWVASEGNLWDVAPGMSIGGGGFENIEGEIPLAYDPDRTFKECDINYEGGFRGAERLVWSDDGYIFYTPDHYESFELLYPHEEA